MTDSPITTIRISDTELQVERTLYLFTSKSDTDAFQRCLADGRSRPATRVIHPFQ
jgi:hypothetical protein